ncbi:hypothetical protein EVAR_94287_1 [Eumeta japonica]|uniref:CTF/NF-I domain-containing protein n=1 Tax=Eumeta variegata TaxID=151549 RepID=A0A4C1UET5_EUMVA|nr:hypothetical protein EVAR_94287_1 [Eumeta japonica]
MRLDSWVEMAFVAACRRHMGAVHASFSLGPSNRAPPRTSSGPEAWPILFVKMIYSNGHIYALSWQSIPYTAAVALVATIKIDIIAGSIVLRLEIYSPGRPLYLRRSVTGSFPVKIGSRAPGAAYPDLALGRCIQALSVDDVTVNALSLSATCGCHLQWASLRFRGLDLEFSTLVSSNWMVDVRWNLITTVATKLPVGIKIRTFGFEGNAFDYRPPSLVCRECIEAYEVMTYLAAVSASSPLGVWVWCGGRMEKRTDIVMGLVPGYNSQVTLSADCYHVSEGNWKKSRVVPHISDWVIRAVSPQVRGGVGHALACEIAEGAPLHARRPAQGVAGARAGAPSSVRGMVMVVLSSRVIVKVTAELRTIRNVLCAHRLLAVRLSHRKTYCINADLYMSNVARAKAPLSTGDRCTGNLPIKFKCVDNTTDALAPQSRFNDTAK